MTFQFREDGQRVRTYEAAELRDVALSCMKIVEAAAALPTPERREAAFAAIFSEECASYMHIREMLREAAIQILITRGIAK